MLSLIIGPMYSEKTTSMVRIVERYRLAGKKCVIIKYTADTRYGDTDSIINHAGHVYDAVDVIRASCIQETLIKCADYDVIAVSESQFYADIMLVMQFVNAGKNVICEGLNGDYRQELFGNLHSLIPLADKITKLSAICSKCGAKASFTKKINIPSEVKIIDIGSFGMYIAVCRSCLAD